MARTFDEARAELLALRARWLKGEPCAARMKEVADEAAAIYNEKAREAAQRIGVKPRLVTADRLMKDGRIIRDHGA